MNKVDRIKGKELNTAGMRWIEGGVFAMGSDAFYPEERPIRRVKVDGFWIDEGPVTNAQFARFVAETGYRTVAEIAPDPADYPGMSPELAQPGSLLFERTPGPVPLDDHSQWWTFSVGTNWRHPTGPDSDIAALADHPVVHVTFADAEAYAGWLGKSLPSEAEWEYAARGGLDGADYAWGDVLAPGGAILANYWRGLFPFANLRDGGAYRTSAVGSFPPNDYGLSDMIGNVWEWTRDWYATAAAIAKQSKACCTISNPRGGTLRGSFDPAEPERFGRKVLKGGSHLCAANYCQRYRPAARHAQAIDSSTSHIGFRCVAPGSWQNNPGLDSRRNRERTERVKKRGTDSLHGRCRWLGSVRCESEALAVDIGGIEVQYRRYVQHRPIRCAHRDAILHADALFHY